MTESSSPTTYL